MVNGITSLTIGQHSRDLSHALGLAFAKQQSRASTYVLWLIDESKRDDRFFVGVQTAFVHLADNRRLSYVAYMNDSLKADAHVAVVKEQVDISLELLTRGRVERRADQHHATANHTVRLGSERYTRCLSDSGHAARQAIAMNGCHGDRTKLSTVVRSDHELIAFLDRSTDDRSTSHCAHARDVVNRINLMTESA